MTPFAMILLVSQWWDSLPPGQHFFFGIGIMAGLATLILAVLALCGLEHHAALDATSLDVDHGGSGIFSVKPITAFFVGFGWSGGIALANGYGLFGASAVAVVSGSAVTAVLVLMFRAILSLKSDGTMRIQEAIGAVGTVYVTLPADQAAGGQIIVNFSGRQETFAALNVADRPVPSGEKVTVLNVIDGRTVLVRPL